MQNTEAWAFLERHHWFIFTVIVVFLLFAENSVNNLIRLLVFVVKRKKAEKEGSNAQGQAGK